MKKIVSLLLTLALLLPALALSEVPADLPTFDFTAEEWLARYQEVVGEDDPYYFTEFSEEGVFPEAFFFPGPYAREQFGEVAGTGVTLISNDESQKVVRIRVSISHNEIPGNFNDISILDPFFDKLRAMSVGCILATDDSLLKDDIDSIFSSVLLEKAEWENFGKATICEKNGFSYSFSFPSDFTLTILPTAK